MTTTERRDEIARDLISLSRMVRDPGCEIVVQVTDGEHLYASGEHVQTSEVTTYEIYKHGFHATVRISEQPDSTRREPAPASQPPVVIG